MQTVYSQNKLLTRQYQEPSGALEVGMYLVLIRFDAKITGQYPVNREQWNGLIIRSLREVAAVVTEK